MSHTTLAPNTDIQPELMCMYAVRFCYFQMHQSVEACPMLIENQLGHLKLNCNNFVRKVILFSKSLAVKKMACSRSENPWRTYILNFETGLPQCKPSADGLGFL